MLFVLYNLLNGISGIVFASSSLRPFSTLHITLVDFTQLNTEIFKRNKWLLISFYFVFFQIYLYKFV